VQSGPPFISESRGTPSHHWAITQDLRSIGMPCLAFSISFEGSIPGDIPYGLSIHDVLWWNPSGHWPGVSHNVKEWSFLTVASHEL
jgi:hypothetical protein